MRVCLFLALGWFPDAKRKKADGHTGKDIARYLGVSRATLYRYLAEDNAARSGGASLIRYGWGLALVGPVVAIRRYSGEIVIVWVERDDLEPSGQ